MQDKKSSQHLIINWGQLFSVRGGIQRDSENFLKEMNRKFKLEIGASKPKLSYARYFHKLANIVSVLGPGIPIDLFKSKNFVEVQLSGYRVMRKDSRHFIRLHDLFPMSNPEWFRFRTRIMFKKALKAAIKSNNTIFVCNSNFTMNTLKAMFPNKTFDAYVLPCSSTLNSEALCNKCKGCNVLWTNLGKFIIMVGTVEPRKNYELVLSATDEIESKIIVIGRYGWRQKRTRKKIRDVENTGKLIWLDQCCDGALQELYKKASLFLSTSIEEGFNLSAMEANFFGLKMILSDNSGHRENYASSANFFTTKEELVSLINGSLPSFQEPLKNRKKESS